MSNTSVDWQNNGYNNSVVITSNKTLALSDCGVVQDVQATCTITLPTAAAGQFFKIRVGAPGITVTVTPQSTDVISGGGFTTTGAGKSLYFTNQNSGSRVGLVGVAADAITIQELDGAPTLS